MQKTISLLIFLLLILSCKKVDTDRQNQIAYTVYSATDLPTDTINYFNVKILNEKQEFILFENQHRFQYSFTTMGKGKAAIEAVSLDSIPLVAVITQNGIRIAQQSGLNVKIEKEFK
ncbi:MAG: hypothetical protein ACK4IK_08970 [Bacteroidia bacterium]